jgi:hypothetical protein
MPSHSRALGRQAATQHPQQQLVHLLWVAAELPATYKDSLVVTQLISCEAVQDPGSGGDPAQKDTAAKDALAIHVADTVAVAVWCSEMRDSRPAHDVWQGLCMCNAAQDCIHVKASTWVTTCDLPWEHKRLAVSARHP